jgi:CBS domain-containing protein
VTASTARVAMVGSAPVFPMPVVDAAAPAALVAYLVIGAIVGAAAVLVTRAVYAVEDAFEKLPVHWMWWPAIGAVVVGVVGYFAPHTMGVGYDNIEAIVSGHLVGRALLVLCTLKFISWVIALGSGTSGGTLAPLFTVGGGLGAGIGALLVATIPAAHVDPRIAALVGMAAMFAGASRAVLASVVFAFETTRQPAALLPLLGGCAAAFLVASAWMRQSIMTVKIARRGVYVPDEYGPDPLMGTLAADCATRVVVSLRSKMTIAEARAAIAAVKSRHAAFPVCDEENRVVGLMSHRALLAAEDPEALLSTLADNAPLTIRSDRTLREVVQDMVEAGAGRAVLVDEHGHLAGILTQRDVISAWRKRALH